MKFGVDSVFNCAYKYQILATLTVNIIVFSHGVGIGWVSPMLSLLQSADTSPIGMSVTVDEASWIGSLISFGAIAGNMIYGVLVEKIGRKRAILGLAFPQMCFWIISFFATNVWHYYVGRLLAGITGGGAYATIPIFVAEIADSKIRGRLASLFLLIQNTGIVFGFVITSYLSPTTVPCIVILFPTSFLFLILFLFPETPQYLLKHRSDEESLKSMKFYRNFKGQTKDEVRKFGEDFDEFKLDILTPGEEEAGFKDFCTPQAIKAMLMGFVLMILGSFTGVSAILSYSGSILQQTGSTLDTNNSTIVIGAIQILGTYIATIMVDNIGRKILMIVSLFGVCMAHLATGAFAYLSHYSDLSDYSWVPVLTLASVVFLANVGIYSVGCVILTEIMPKKIRAMGSAVCYVVSGVISFLFLKSFPLLMAIFGLSVVLWICATIAALGLVFIIACVQETNGKSLDKETIISDNKT